MAAGNNIARTILTWMAAVISVCLLVGSPALADTLHVIVEDGESSFLVDVENNEIWWVTDECRHEIPVLQNDDTPDKSKTIISSDRFLKEVQIGTHRFTLEQQFRFDTVSQAPTLQVFNSARGGWSTINVRIDNTCESDLTCRRRMELPLCTD